MIDAKLICALGSGDIESMPFIEALCQLFYHLGVFVLTHALVLSFKGIIPLDKNIFSCKVHYQTNYTIHLWILQAQEIFVWSM